MRHYKMLKKKNIFTSPGSLNHISGCNLCGCCFFAINSSIVLSSSSIELSLSEEELLQASDLCLHKRALVFLGGGS